MKDDALSTALLVAWLSARPEVRIVAREVLGREDPFAGNLTPQFFDRIEAFVPSDEIHALRVLSPPIAVEPDGTKTIAEPGSEPVEVQEQILAATGNGNSLAELTRPVAQEIRVAPACTARPARVE